MINNIIFEYPYAFVLPIVYLICLKFCKQKQKVVFFPNIALLQKASAKKMWLQNITNFLLILTLTVSIASLIKKDDIVMRDDKGYEISLILDVSGSMEQFNKLKIVKDIVANFIDKRQHDKLALSIFADFAYVAIPLTYDKQSIKRLLSKIDVGIAGVNKTALYEALFLSSNLFKTSKTKEKIAILLTDGKDNANTIPLDVAIKTAKKYKIKVYTIGVGKAGDFNPDVLGKISNQTNGKYYHANTIQGLENIYKDINKLEKSKIQIEKYIKKTYYFQYSLILSVLFLLISIFLRGKGFRR
jgi:Ca-activated chloride channel family protein